MFYKYLSVESSRRFLDDINNQQIAFSCPANFNDPFDCYIPVNGYSNPKEVVEQIKQNSLIAKINPDFFQKLAEQLINDPQIQTDNLREHLRTWPLFCMSSEKSSNLMWAHYASKFAGVLVAFRETTNLWKKVEEDGRWPFRAMEVHYTNERPNIILGKDHDNDFIRAILTKNINWKYESEWRVIGVSKTSQGKSWKEKIQQNGRLFYKFDFDPVGVQEIVLGPSISAELEIEIRNRLRLLQHIQISKLSLDNQTYDLH